MGVEEKPSALKEEQEGRSCPAPGDWPAACVPVSVPGVPVLVDLEVGSDCTSASTFSTFLVPIGASLRVNECLGPFCGCYRTGTKSLSIESLA